MAEFGWGGKRRGGAGVCGCRGGRPGLAGKRKAAFDGATAKADARLWRLPTAASNPRPTPGMAEAYVSL